MKYLSGFFVFIFIAYCSVLGGQNVNLANQYFEEGEYEKAAAVFESLWLKNKSSEYYIGRLTDCYHALGKPDLALKVLNDAIASDPKLFPMRATRAGLYYKMNNNKAGDEEIANILKLLPKNQSIISRTAYTLDRINKSDVAIEVLEKGTQLLGDKLIFANELANFYAKTGQREKMLNVYLDLLAVSPELYNQLTTMIQRTYTNPSDYDELLPIVFEKVQDNPSNPQYIELLSWTYIQKRDFKNALRQMKAIDLQMGDQSNKIFKLAQTTYHEKAYDIAMDAFKYLMQKEGMTPFLFESGRFYLKSLVASKLVNTDLSSTDVALIEAEYKDFLGKYGETGRTTSISDDYAEFLVLYKKDLNAAIITLQEIVEKKGVPVRDKAPLKIKLADYLIMQGDRWEASLLYSQVDKDYKEEPIGQEARYKNALLSYYTGDFEWAQTQFSVLKSATSRMIANDAIDRSVFIIDNLGLDTTETALRMYAKSELLTYQNRLIEATNILDSLLMLFPGHSLDDDVLYAKAQIFMKQKRYDEAIAAYEKIMTDFKDEIRCDNAIYELALLYENVLQKKDEAMQLYETLFNDYSASVFAVDARQRYRQLRGDSVQ